MARTSPYANMASTPPPLGAVYYLTIQNSVYTLKNFFISVLMFLLDEKLLSRMHNFYNTCNFEKQWNIRFCITTFARHHGISSCREHVKEQFSRVPTIIRCRWHLQLLREPPVVQSTSSCREHFQLSRVPPVIENTSSCRKYLQLSRAPPVVESTSSCPKYLQLSRALPVVQSTSSCREHLQLSKVPPVVESTSSCREHLQLSKVPAAVESDFCQTGSVIVYGWNFLRCLLSLENFNSTFSMSYI